MCAKVAFFHTVAGLAERFDELADEYVPEAERFHLVDESVLQEALEVGELTPAVNNRICTQLSLAERAGADVVLDTCSSTSPAVDVARELVGVPILKIDDPMTERAVELGERIAVLATASSTLGPSTELVERKGAQAGKDVTVEPEFVDGALEARESGDVGRHDELIADRALSVAEDVDVIVLAQASMSHLRPELEERSPVPVLSSPESAMEAVREELGSE